MDLRKIKKLIELVEESGIAELEVTSGDEAVRIVRPFANSIPQIATDQLGVAPTEVATSGNAVAEPTPAKASSTLHAPMAGTFYLAPEPGAEPFVQVGQAVEVGAVVCIIESMKMMNEVRADTAGTCLELLVENGEPIGTGQPLIRLG